MVDFDEWFDTEIFGSINFWIPTIIGGIMVIVVTSFWKTVPGVKGMRIIGVIGSLLIGYIMAVRNQNRGD